MAQPFTIAEAVTNGIRHLRREYEGSALSLSRIAEDYAWHAVQEGNTKARVYWTLVARSCRGEVRV